MFWLLLACRSAVRFDDPLPPDDWLPRAEAPAGDAARYADAAAWSEEHAGLALLVIEGDAIVFEAYADGYAAETPHHLFSGTKTFACALYAAAAAEGEVTLDELASDTLSEWTEDGRRDITVRHLLQFTSGLDQAWWTLTWDGLKERPRVDDKYAYAVDRPLKHVPGEVFEYGSAHLYAFGALMERKLDGDSLAYLAERVLDPIGLRVAGWIRDPAGQPAWPYGAFTTANEWAKFGVLLRDDGEFLGERVLPEGALAECRAGSAANPAYGLATWLNVDVPEDTDLSAFRTIEDDGPPIWNDGPDDLFMAAGAQDQRLYVIPSRDLVVVRLGDGHRGFRDAELLARVLGAP